jgi:hypothetical protein
MSEIRFFTGVRVRSPFKLMDELNEKSAREKPTLMTFLAAVVVLV